MGDIGKVEQSFLDTAVYERLGADRDDIRLGPGHGVDFGVIDVGSNVVVVAADPLFVPLELGVDRAAWYGFHILVSDVALSGLAPSHLSVSVSLPPDADLTRFEEVWGVINQEAHTHDVGIVTGHTGRYEGCSYPYIGGGTAFAVGDPADLITPRGATPGDAVVVTKGPAIETVGVIATRFGEQLELPTEIVDRATDRFWEMNVLPDTRCVAGTDGVTAMHDATERGIDNALHELAAAADVELVVDRDRFPIGAGVTEVCSVLGIDPWTASSTGTVVMTVDEASLDDVLDALATNGVRAAHVGTVQEGSGVVVDGEDLPEPETDPFWRVYSSLGE